MIHGNERQKTGFLSALKKAFNIAIVDVTPADPVVLRAGIVSLLVPACLYVGILGSNSDGMTSAAIWYFFIRWLPASACKVQHHGNDDKADYRDGTNIHIAHALAFKKTGQTYHPFAKGWFRSPEQ
uniref:poly(3-hydroxybutyrate) depolymerase n=1 Tax=Salmonella sp. TaxID=599 RepID=UPI001CD957E2|nr:poly(3-hydroxybutyrate) depolymerase [Salmonella sp.]